MATASTTLPTTRTPLYPEDQYSELVAAIVAGFPTLPPDEKRKLGTLLGG